MKAMPGSLATRITATMVTESMSARALKPPTKACPKSWRTDVLRVRWNSEVFVR